MSDNVLTTRSINATAAGTSDINGTSVDTQTVPADAVRAVCLMGTLTATQVTKLVIEDSADDVTFAAVKTGTAAPDADGNKMLVVDASLKGRNRYIRATVDRGTANAVIDGVILEFYRLRAEKVAQHANVSKLDLGV
jgi:hypothetical protein